jgi:hypothetical protein
MRGRVRSYALALGAALFAAAPFKYSLSENQEIGSDTGTPVTYDYTPPFAFQGTLNEVDVVLGR